MNLRIATFNIRNVTDRYHERMPLLGAAFAEIDADLIGLQEVIVSDGGPGKPRQDDFLSGQLPERHYKSLVSPHATRPYFSNAILCAVGEIQTHEQLRLSTGRSAHRILLVVEGKTLWFANTHLHHKPEEPEVRVEQAQAIVEWMRDAPAANASLIVGDFNTPPREPAYSLMTSGGYQSVYRTVNGEEPLVTWPSGIQAETMDVEGDPACLDYIWMAGNIHATAAHLAANRPPADDPSLYPSDHFAIVAEMVLG